MSDVRGGQGQGVPRLMSGGPGEPVRSGRG